jgi:hypothetical protein
VLESDTVVTGAADGPESRGFVAHDARRPHRAPAVELGAVLAATHTAAADVLDLGQAGWS